MSASYTCPNPECGANLKTPARVAAGKSVKCPKCNKPFVPEAAEETAPVGGGGLKFADEAAKKKSAGPTKPGKKTAAKPEPKKEEPAIPLPRKPFADDQEESDESIKKGYGIVKATEAEQEEGEKNKPKFTSVQDKFKKSARGPALALLVLPSNLLTGEGLLTIGAGILMFVLGMWPLVFNDAPPGEEELEEAVMSMIVGVSIFGWGALVCFGASQMQELGSYPWAMTGSVMGILPLGGGIFGLLMLQNPKVKAGFEEGEGGPNDADKDEEDKKDEDEDEEEDEEEGEEEDDE